MIDPPCMPHHRIKPRSERPSPYLIGDSIVFRRIAEEHCIMIGGIELAR
jgi:hypothetical protein